MNINDLVQATKPRTKPNSGVDITHRKGLINIPTSLLSRALAGDTTAAWDVHRMLEKCLVIRAVPLLVHPVMEYTVCHEDFRELALGAIDIPTYVASIASGTVQYIEQP